MKTFILDNGHGGVINGVYQTPGKRSPIWSDGRQLFEGEFNRAIVERIANLCKQENYKYHILVPELIDISLVERVQRSNRIFMKDRNAVQISIHANAGGGTGFEIWTAVGETKSDKYATEPFRTMEAEFPELKPRADMHDGDPDKESMFYINAKSLCPSFLIECAFMDTLTPDCELLMSEEGRDRFARSIFAGMKKIYNMP